MEISRDTEKSCVKYKLNLKQGKGAKPLKELKKARCKKNDENVKFCSGSKIIDYLKVCLVLLDYIVFHEDGSSEGAQNIMRRTLGNCFLTVLWLAPP